MPQVVKVVKTFPECRLSPKLSETRQDEKLFPLVLQMGRSFKCIYLFIYLRIYYLSVYLFIYIFIYLSIYLFV